MRSTLELFCCGLLLAVCAGTAAADDLEVGTWNLNLSQSTFNPGPAPKNQTRIYAESPQGLAVTIRTTPLDGKDTVVTLNYENDGKSYPATGTPDFDMVSVTRVDAYTVNSTQTKAGASVGKIVRTLSKDGKTLTVKQQGTLADGTDYDNVLVYDRQ